MSSEAPSKSWTVEVDGVDRRVTVETDPESGRSQIRVDGRMAARPLGANEQERQFSIGSTAYILRRDENGELDLDLDPNAPATPVAPPAWKMKPPEEKPRSRVKGKIIAAIVAVILIPAVRWSVDAVHYMRVPWKKYDAPDRRWQVSFPEPPKEETENLSAGGMSLRTVEMKSRYRNHIYALEWVEFPFYIPVEKESELITSVLDSMVKGEQATLIKKEWSSVSLHDSMHFFMRMPKNKDWSGGTARGHIVRSGNRLYILYAYVPPRESLSFDVGEFFRSFRLPDND